MARAPNVHKALFEAIERQYATDGDLLQLVPTQLFRDFVPPNGDDGKPQPYPVVMVSQGQEGGSTEWCVTGDGLDVLDEKYAISFDVAASTRETAGQIAWQIVHVFKDWRGTFGDIEIKETFRASPPWIGSEEQGVCLASVSFVVSAMSTEEE